MIGRINRTVAIAATGALAVGGGVAYAASSENDKDKPAHRGALMLELRDGPHGHPGPPGVPHGGPPGMSAAAEYLGLTERQLFRRLRNGNSLADVAEAEGKSKDGLVDALVAEVRERIEEQVEAEPGTFGPPPHLHRRHP